MSGTSTSRATSDDMAGTSLTGKDGQRWAALDSRNERLASAAELRLLTLDRAHADAGRPRPEDRELKAAS